MNANEAFRTAQSVAGWDLIQKDIRTCVESACKNGRLSATYIGEIDEISEEYLELLGYQSEEIDKTEDGKPINKISWRKQ